MSAPLPVVPCWITTAGAPDVTTREVERITFAPSYDAVALPWALLKDAGFVEAVHAQRDRLMGLPDGVRTRAGGLALTMRALAAELRERAGRLG